MARRIPQSELFDAIWSWAWDDRLCPAGSINVQPVDYTAIQEPEQGVVTDADEEEAQSLGAEPGLLDKERKR
jgi:hypothetical protein